MELTTGREASYGDEHTSLAKWAWRYIKDDIPIVDALDEEIKEPSYLEEMNSVSFLESFVQIQNLLSGLP